MNKIFRRIGIGFGFLMTAIASFLIGAILVGYLAFNHRNDTQAAPTHADTRAFDDDLDAMLSSPLRYQIGSTDKVIVVPVGFVTDYTSTPVGLRGVIPQHGQYSRAAIIHDYLYWTQLCTRKEADTLLLLAMKESDVDDTKQFEIYRGIRWGGWAAWKSNAEEKHEGLIRMVPERSRELPSNMGWDEYRKILRAENIVEPPLSDTGAYCSLGDSTDVPSVSEKVDGGTCDPGESSPLVCKKG